MRISGLPAAAALLTVVVAPTAGAEAAKAPPIGAARPPALISGVTVDVVGQLSRTVASLRHLSRRPWTRIVMDVNRARPTALGPYPAAASRLSRVSDVMAEVADSSELRQVSAAELARRTARYVRAMGNDVSVWEIGNEVNGSWAGPPASVARKVTSAYRQVARAAGRTALTLYENQGCGDGRDELGPAAWSRAYLPRRIRSHLDFVLLSYYEPQCRNIRPSAGEWAPRFRSLHRAFPTARLGFGEVGLPHPANSATTARARSVVRRYYRMRLALPYFIGGGFYWYYVEDMTPWRSAPLWHALNRAIAG